MHIFGKEIIFGSRLRKTIIGVAFLAGLVFFFPIGSLETRLNDTLSKTLAGDVRVMNPRLGLGLRTGVISGGLFGIKADQIEITLLQAPQPITCFDPVISPKILAMFILRLQIAIRCDLGDERSPILVVAKAPIFNPTQLSVDLEVENLSISEAASLARVSGMDGVMSGQLSLANLEGGIGRATVEWDLELKDLHTPALNTDFGSLPPMNFTHVETEGSSANRKIKMKPLKLGEDNKDPLVTDLELELGFAGNGNLTSGFIQGNLKSTPEFDRSMASLVNMDQVFGKAKNNGTRRFRKNIEGNFLSLLGPPEEHP